jgi:hypothetical protein
MLSQQIQIASVMDELPLGRFIEHAVGIVLGQIPTLSKC